MKLELISSFEVSDLLVRYLLDPGAGQIGLSLIPAKLLDRRAVRRAGLRGLSYIDGIPSVGNPPAWTLDPLVHLKLAGDAYPAGFAQGHTMRGAESNSAFFYDTQRVERERTRVVVVTVCRSRTGLRVEHRLSWQQGDASMEVWTEFFNDSPEPVCLEMLSSFSLGDLTPFAEDDASGRLRVHRFRSVWSAEGRLETRSLEALHLERSWSGAGAFSERFGQVGSMPVRKWFPFVALEDTAAGVIWGAQLAWAGSWQMEIFRQHDNVCLSGGLADREFGHWTKRVAPGQTFSSPKAVLACVEGDLDDLCERLAARQHRAADRQPAVEQDLPIVFNEWCTSWGEPRHERIVEIAQRLAGTPVKYLVIDAGWYKTDGVEWASSQGDWVPNPRLFPQGLEATATAIRQQGLIPGLWFEMEVAGRNAQAFNQAGHLLQRDGVPLTVGDRRFWSFQDPWVLEYLTERLIGLLERCGFGYLKVDYNDSLGIGCDHPDSLGEGLRQQIEASQRFFETIRRRLPHLVIENCSSGGHRLEPSMLGLTAMSSFSDAHELVEIPIIAANLHRLMLPRQSQIWAVVHRSDGEQRLVYSLAATFLGRMCLSGEIAGLNPAQWQVVQRAMELYRKVVPIIKEGRSRRFGEIGESWRHPHGWQAVVRTSRDEQVALLVLHSFAQAPAQIAVPLPSGSWSVRERLGGEDLSQPKWGTGFLKLKTTGDFCGQVMVLERATAK